MSIFNYNTTRDPIEGLASRIARMERIFRNLKFWEVNDVALGANVLKRRKVTPSILIGSVGRGEWHDILGMGNSAMGSGGTTSYADYEFGFATPTTAVVSVNSGELQDSALAVKVVATADKTIATGTVNYIYVQYVFGGTPTIEVSQTRPTVDATTTRIILHQWTLVGGVATLSKISHLGNIYIPGTFGTQT